MYLIQISNKIYQLIDLNVSYKHEEMKYQYD